MTTVQQEAPATNTGTESPLSDGTDSTRRVAKISFELNDLSGNELDHLWPILRDRAAERRVRLTDEAAMDAFLNAPVNIYHQSSPFQAEAKIRNAVRILISERGFHQEQIESPMRVVALSVCSHYRTAIESVNAGVADALAVLKDRAGQ